jgi:hypothetical protein
MTADEWIDEFTQHSNRSPKTVLHASNVPPVSRGVVRGAATEGRHVDATSNAVQRYPLASMFVAGFVGFVVARTLVS